MPKKSADCITVSVLVPLQLILKKVCARFDHMLKIVDFLKITVRSISRFRPIILKFEKKVQLIYYNF